MTKTYHKRFLLAGCGETNRYNETNVRVVDSDTTSSQIVKWLDRFIKRRDILVIAISKAAAEKARTYISNVEEAVPQIIEIPNKYDSDYEFETQSFQRRFGNFDPNSIETVTEEEVSFAAISVSSTAMPVADIGQASSLEHRRSNAPYLSATAIQTLEDARHNQSGIFAQNQQPFSPSRFSIASVPSIASHKLHRRTLKFDDEKSESFMSVTSSKLMKKADQKKQKEDDKKKRKETKEKEKEQKEKKSDKKK